MIATEEPCVKLIIMQLNLFFSLLFLEMKNSSQMTVAVVVVATTTTTTTLTFHLTLADYNGRSDADQLDVIVKNTNVK
jgi:hypothetical protein